MCTLGFQGMGYSPRFSENFTKIKAQLTNDPETLIQFKSQLDVVCAPCPHNLGDGRCASQSKIQKLDDRHQTILQLEPGRSMTWQAALKRIKTHMTVEEFHRACEGCEWKSLGVCERALKSLLHS